MPAHHHHRRRGHVRPALPLLLTAACSATTLARADPCAPLVAAATGRAWIDSASGRLLRVDTDQPDTDVGFKLDPKTRQGRVTYRTNTPRVQQRHVWLYGADVKPPGPGGTVDAAALAALQALLK